MADTLTPDLCIIGAGAGGLAAAESARALGASVVLVERDKLGGNLLKLGTLPTRALGAAAAHAAAMRTAPAFGISAEEPKPMFRRVHDHVDQVIAGSIALHSEARLNALGVTLLKGAAKFLDKDTAEVGDTHVKARRFIVATGAAPVLPEIPGLSGVPFFTSETIADNTRKLTHLLVVGAGAIGLELAQAYRRLGSDVTVVEHATPLAGFDPELADIALRRLQEEGVLIIRNATVTAIQSRSMGIGATVREGETDRPLDVSHILVATGRTPNLEGLNLEAAGVRRDPADAGRLQLGKANRTSNPRIYVVGDAAGGPQSAHGAVAEANRAVRAAFMLRQDDPAQQPRVAYLDPELAEIGMSEAEARKRHGESFQVLRAGFADNDLARARRQTLGLVKVIAAPTGRLLGAGIVGPGAAELAALFALAIAQRLAVRDLAALPAPMPSLADLVRRLGEQAVIAAGPDPWLKRWLSLTRLLR